MGDKVQRFRNRATMGIVVVGCLFLLAASGHAQQDCSVLYDQMKYAGYAKCAAGQSDASMAKVGYAHLRMGWLSFLGASLADSLYGRSQKEFSAAQQGVNLASPLDAYYAALLLLSRGDYGAAGSGFRKFAGVKPGAQVPAKLTARAAALADACAGWAGRGEAVNAKSRADAAVMEAWNMAGKGVWPDAGRLAGAPDDALARLLSALAKRNPDAVRKGIFDDALFVPDFAPNPGEGEREFADPLSARIVAKGHFFLAEKAYLKGAESGKSAYLEDAAFAALLAGDMAGLGEIVAKTNAPFGRCYRAALPNAGSEDRASLTSSSADAAMALAQARVVGLSVGDWKASLEKYQALIGSSKESKKREWLLDESACIALFGQTYEDAYRRFDEVWQSDHVRPVAVLGRSFADIGRQDFKSFFSTSLLLEELTIQGGLLDEYRFLYPLKVNAWLFVRLHAPIDSQGTRPR